MNRRVVALSFGFFLLPLASSIAATTAFYYEPLDNGSYIAASTGGVLLEENFAWYFHKPQNAYSGNAMTFTIAGPSNAWTIQVEMPFDAPLEKGSYIAVRFPFNSDHFTGFSWQGFGRGLNTLTAEFTILEVAFDADGAISSFAMDFIQYEETWNEIDIPTLIAGEYQSAFGSYRYHSTIPVNTSGSLSPIPEPHSVLLSLAGGFVCVGRRSRKPTR